MDIKVKIAAVLGLFVVAGGVGFSLAWPAYEEWTAKASQLEEKKNEESTLDTKLANSAKIQREKQETEAAIEALRGAIPKKPELEILNIDLEKMCKESNVDLVAFKEADTQTLKDAGLDDDTIKMKTSAQALKDKIKGKVGTAQAASSGGAAQAKKDKDDNTGTGLSKLILSVKCIGDYADIMKLIRRMETYQRVVAITEVKASIPKLVKAEKGKKLELPDIDQQPSETEEQGDYHRLNCSLLLTAYYLP